VEKIFYEVRRNGSDHECKERNKNGRIGEGGIGGRIGGWNKGDSFEDETQKGCGDIAVKKGLIEVLKKEIILEE